MAQNTQSENSWHIPVELLTSLVGPEFEEPDISGDYPPRWFRLKKKNSYGETPEEVRERKIAVQEQINMGIIKPSKNTTPKLIQNQPHSKHLQEFVSNLKKDADKVDNTNSFRPKVRDAKSGKVRKLGPNDKCPCGSGKKYKKCHGRGKF